MVNILEIAPGIYPGFRTGGPVFTEKLFRDSLRGKCNFTIFSTQLGFEDIPFSDARDVIKVSNPDDCVFVDRYFGSKSLTFSPSQMLRILFSFRRFDVLVLQGIWNSSFLLCFLLSFIFKMHIIAFTHGTILDETLSMGHFRLKRIFIRFFLNYTCQYTTFVTNSPSEYTYVSRLFCSKSRVVMIPNQIDFNVIDEINNITVAPNVGNVWCHYGRVTRKKNLELAIRLFAEVCSSNDDATFRIIGPIEDSNYRDELLTLSENLGIFNKVHFLSGFEHKVALTKLKECDLFVLLSHSENFGVAVVEALALGLPVVISDKVGVGYFLNEYAEGVFIAPLHEGSFSDLFCKSNLVNFLNFADANRESIRSGGPLYAKKIFSSEKIGKIFAQLVDNHVIERSND